MTNIDSILKTRDISQLIKTSLSWETQSCGFSTCHIWIWEVNHKKGWASKNWCFQTVVLEKTLESSLDSREIKPINPKGNQPWIFTGRTDAKAEAPILWPPDAKKWLIGKGPDAGKDWGQEEKWTTEDEMVGWHHWFNGHEFKQTLKLVKNREAWSAVVHDLQRVGHNWTAEQQEMRVTVLEMPEKDLKLVMIKCFNKQLWTYLKQTKNFLANRKSQQ